MSKKKGKFDFTHIVKEGYLKENQKIYFVSDTTKFATVQKQPNGEFKIFADGATTTLHAFAQKCLGMDPPDHATKWFKAENGKTIYEFWQESEGSEERYAA